MGSAQGKVIYTDESLSFWGGYDAQTGEIIDQRHELCGTIVAGHIFVLPGGRGSSTGSGILLESIRLGKAPAAMILSHADQILALGTIVAQELYGRTMPMVVVSEAEFTALKGVDHVQIDETGAIDWE